MNIQSIHVAVDAVIFTVIDSVFHVLLIKIKSGPFPGKWAFPGGMIDDKETTRTAALRILESKTGVDNAYLEQLATFDDPKRDPRGRTISTAYFALMPSAGITLRTTERYSDVRWWPVHELPRLAYDHDEIARIAVERVQSKLTYSNIAWSLLPRDFTLTDLQQIYEAILGRALDKRNFRKKILSLNLLAPVGKQTKTGLGRPAELFRFRRRETIEVDML